MATTTQSVTTKKIPGPIPLGTAVEYWRYIQFFIDPLKAFRKHYKTYGEISAPLGTFEDGRKGVVMVVGAQYNQQLLSDPSVYYSPDLGGKAGSSMKQLETGLVMENGERHRAHRRLVLPAFHKKYIESYRDDMVGYTDAMLANWQAGAVLDLKHEMHTLAMQIANKTLFGLETVEENLGALINNWLNLMVHPLGRVFPYDLPGFPYQRLLKSSDEVVAKIRDVIARKRKNLGNDVLSTMLETHDEDGNALTDDELIGQTNILYVAGHETSANAMMWTLYFLSQHPKLLKDLTDEIEGVLHGAAPVVEQLGQFTLLERVIKETLRLMPPLPWQLRTAQEDFELGPYRLSEGSTILYSHYITHRLPEIFDQPDKFMPERWENANPSPYEYIPFSAGPRLCVGAPFAMMEMKIVLSMVLQRFCLEMTPNATVDYQALPTLTVKKTLPMKVYPRGANINVIYALGNLNELIMD
jgi:cytochrome P450